MKKLKQLSAAFIIAGILGMIISIVAKNRFDLAADTTSVVNNASCVSIILGILLRIIFYIKTKNREALKQYAICLFVFMVFLFLFYFLKRY